MKKLIFRVARLKIMGTFVGLAIAYIPALIPVKKVARNQKAFAFYHPVPSYPDHILVVPRKVARTVFSLTADDFLEIVFLAICIREDDDDDFTLMINGGQRQDVMQAHFHLFTGKLSAQKASPRENRQNFSPRDIHFWKQTVENLPALLKASHISEKRFSMVMQFTKDHAPTLSFI